MVALGLPLDSAAASSLPVCCSAILYAEPDATATAWLLCSLDVWQGVGPLRPASVLQAVNIMKEEEAQRKAEAAAERKRRKEEQV